jgi:uncharacterized protein
MSKLTLADYAEKNDLFKIEELLKSGIDINERESGSSALHRAVVYNSKDAAQLLIERNIDINLKDERGATALHYCAQYNRLEISKIILSNKGRLDIEDNYGNQPLWTAVFNVKKDLSGLDLVELYLQYGADKNHKNNAGRSPLDFANQVQFAPLLEVLNKY